MAYITLYFDLCFCNVRQDVGDRPDYRNIAVIFTDGGSNDFKETLKAAREVKEDGTTILVVPIGGWVNHQEVNLMASDPVEKNVFKVDDFDQIDSIQSQLKAAMCNGELM